MFSKYPVCVCVYEAHLCEERESINMITCAKQTHFFAIDCEMRTFSEIIFVRFGFLKEIMCPSIASSSIMGSKIFPLQFIDANKKAIRKYIVKNTAAKNLKISILLKATAVTSINSQNNLSVC